MRMSPKVRKQQLLETTVKLIADGETTPTRNMIAYAADISPTLITHYWGMSDLRNAAIKEGCRRRIRAVMLYACAINHPSGKALPKSVKRSLFNA